MGDPLPIRVALVAAPWPAGGAAAPGQGACRAASRQQQRGHSPDRVGRAERDFNQEFVSVCEHYGLIPRTINIECPNENGDVESANGHLKRRLNQHLLLRGSREFVSEADYEAFSWAGAQQGQPRPDQEPLTEELAAMRTLPPTRLSEYEEVYCPVSKPAPSGSKRSAIRCRPG